MSAKPPCGGSERAVLICRLCSTSRISTFNGPLCVQVEDSRAIMTLRDVWDGSSMRERVLVGLNFVLLLGWYFSSGGGAHVSGSSASLVGDSIVLFVSLDCQHMARAED